MYSVGDHLYFLIKRLYLCRIYLPIALSPFLKCIQNSQIRFRWTDGQWLQTLIFKVYF